MKYKFYIELERVTGLNMNGTLDDTSMISCVLYKSSAKHKEELYLEIGNTFDVINKANLTNPANLMYELSEIRKENWFVDLIEAGEYEFAGTKVTIGIFDVLEFYKEHYTVTDKDRVLLDKLLIPYIKQVENTGNIQQLIFNLLKYSLNEDTDINEIKEGLQSLI